MFFVRVGSGGRRFDRHDVDLLDTRLAQVWDADDLLSAWR